MAFALKKEVKLEEPSNSFQSQSAEIAEQSSNNNEGKGGVATEVSPKGNFPTVEEKGVVKGTKKMYEFNRVIKKWKG